MTDRPILFSSEMVRALLDGRKTMTRRYAWREPTMVDNPQGFIRLGELRDQGLVDAAQRRGERPSPWQRVKPGDRLWVREAWYTWGVFDDLPPSRLTGKEGVSYLADEYVGLRPGKSRVAIHMPRWASRLTLEVTATRMERLQEITQTDAAAEGLADGVHGDRHTSPRNAFRLLWDSLHGAGAWETNPEVVAIAFEAHQINIDSLPAAQAPAAGDHHSTNQGA